MNVSTAKVLTNITPYGIDLALGQGAYSVAVFKDSLYLAEISIYIDSDQEREFSRVMRYNPQGKSWQELYGSFLSSEENSQESRIGEKNDEFSFDRAGPQGESVLESEMIWFPGSAQSEETLYLRLNSPSREQLLRSDDGETFQVIQPVPVGLAELLSRRRFRRFQDQLYTLPALGAEQDLEIEDPCLVHIATSISGEPWREANLPNFGDASNRGISELVAYDDCLYAGTINPEKGFQLWQTPAQDPPPHVWKSVLSQGASRYSLNQWVFNLVPFKGDLYIASGLYLERGKEHLNPFYPAGFEILRLYPDRDWDIIAGTPKFTKEGLKIPLSLMGAGFDDPYNCSVQCLAAYGDSLYLGTHNLEQFQLWHSEDGEYWEQLILEDDFSSYYQIEVQKALTTSWGLILWLNRVEPNGIKKQQIYLVES
jgi:hypothetical protein